METNHLEHIVFLCKHKLIKCQTVYVFLAVILKIGTFTVSVFYDVSLKLSHCQCSDIKRSEVSHVGEEELGSCQ